MNFCCKGVYRYLNNTTIGNSVNKTTAGIGSFSMYSDEELMTFISRGEVRAFDALYERYARRLMVYFTRMLNFDKNLAEDALQDLFMKIAESPEKFDSSRSFKTWVFSVASNSCKNYYRHRQVVIKHREEQVKDESRYDGKEFLNTAAKIDHTVFRQMLDEVLTQLPHEKREAFILKYQEERSIAEIAFIQQCPEGSVKSRLHYTLKVLEEKLKLFNPIQ